MKNNIIKSIILFIIFGFIYCGIEIAWRGYTHPSMFIVGGLCCLLVGLTNEITPKMLMDMGVKAVFLDLDSTIMVSKSGKFLPETYKWFETLKKDLTPSVK